MIHLNKFNLKKSRKIKFVYNTSSSIILQFMNIICGFILPRAILNYFGSDTNGVVASITQYLAFINFMDMGVGAVTQSAYYKPLAQNDTTEVLAIYNESSRFFKRIGVVLITYIVFLCVILPRVLISSYSAEYIIFLVLILSFNQFNQFFFAIPDQLLLSASQNGYIINITQAILITINTIVSILFIKLGNSIHMVKFASALVFFVNPIILHIITLRKFGIKKIKKDRTIHISQKKNGFAQHCATVIMNNTDIMVLSVLTPVSTVSIYTVYALVTNGIKQFISAISNGFFSLLGDLYAREESENLDDVFNLFQWGISTISVFFFSVTTLLIVPFVQLYTYDINDADYFQPAFAYILVLSQFIFCLRIPCNTMICSAGHYKQTQLSAIIEVALNMTFSIMLVFKFGLIGVAIGTFIAITYRTISFYKYLHDNILYIKYRCIIKQMFINLVELLLIILIGTMLMKSVILITGTISFIMVGFLLVIIALGVIVIMNYIFYKKVFEIIKNELFKKKRVCGRN